MGVTCATSPSPKGKKKRKSESEDEPDWGSSCWQSFSDESESGLSDDDMTRETLRNERWRRKIRPPAGPALG